MMCENSKGWKQNEAPVHATNIYASYIKPMSVLLETSKGDIVIDLLVDDCPITCKNFIKLCKTKYYNNCIFHNVQRNFIIQTGDPTSTGKGGTSIYGLLYGEQARFFEDEIRPHLKHKRRGVVGMASAGENLNASQFYITTGEELDSLDEKHTIFGQVAEGLDVIDKINESFCDDAGRPFQNIRIRHTIVLDDPYPDPSELDQHIPENSPEPEFEQGGRLEEDWALNQDTRPAEEIEQEGRRAEAHNRAVVLEMIGDLPEADAAPPSNMVFVCKLNAVTTEEDLEIIFSRFGRITSCDIIRDWKTGDSLCYGFIGLDSDAACEEAYFKMNNVLIDDRRIKVDFSQSVNHLWKQFKKGGRKGGNAEMAAQAAGHERDSGVANARLGGGGGGLSGGRLELKAHGGGGRGGSAPQRQHMLMDDDEVREARGMAKPRPHEGSRDGPDHHHSGRADRPHGSSGGKHHESKHRDRSRSADRKKSSSRHHDRQDRREDGDRRRVEEDRGGRYEGHRSGRDDEGHRDERSRDRHDRHDERGRGDERRDDRRRDEKRARDDRR